MKKFFGVGMLFSLVFFSSCLGGGKNQNENGEENAEETVDAANLSMERANNIIQYYNDALEVFRRLYEDKDQEKVLKYMAERKSRIGSGPVITHTIGLRDTTKIVSPGNFFAKATQEKVKQDVGAFLRAGEKFYQNFNAYKSYVKAEDYKDDNWAKGNQLLEENKKLAEEITAARERIYAIISPMANEAEIVTLEGNPWKNHIVLSKQIFVSMESILEEYVADKPSAEKIDAAYTKLESQVEKARQLPDAGETQRKMDNFNRFLDQADEFMGEVRKLKREGKYTERGYRKLTNEYDRVIRRYNNFVN